MESQNKSGIGSIIATIIIIALIILGGLYFWGKRVEESKMKQDLVTGSDQMTPGDETANVNNASSDDLNSIEADLNATNMDNLGAEMDAT